MDIVYRDLIWHFLTYKALLHSAINEIETFWLSRYADFVAEQKDSALNHLSSYVIDRKYTLPSSAFYPLLKYHQLILRYTMLKKILSGPI